MRFLATTMILGLVGTGGCRRAPGAEPRQVVTTPVGVASAGVQSSAPAIAAQATLEQMDSRVPVPLLPMMANHQKQNMRDHLVAVQEIVLALARSNYAGVEKAAKRMGYSDEMGHMCTRMGAGAPEFTEQALTFHHTADTIASAAHARDRGAVMRALGSTMQTCTGCHATFRQSVVDEPTWSRITSMNVPSGHGHPTKP